MFCLVFARLRSSRRSLSLVVSALLASREKPERTTHRVHRIACDDGLCATGIERRPSNPSVQRKWNVSQ